MIKISQPNILRLDNNRSRLSCDIYVDNELRNVWFEVERECEKYLCTERLDAFLIGLLPYAMRNNHNIECAIPVTDELLYNIETYVIPSLSKYAKALYAINIKADMAPALDNEGCVGTGCSCGVDSFHSILNNFNSKYQNLKLTHICLFNVGSFGNRKDTSIDSEELYSTRLKAVKSVADYLGLKALITNSNFADMFRQEHILVNTYSSVFALYCLQKLFKTYFYASCHDFSHFRLENNDEQDTSYTDLLLLNSFSHKNLRLYSEGGQKTRLEKTQFIADNKIVQNYLHVCVTKSSNCGSCFKCVRTMNSLYALKKLDKFSKVFDVEYYKKHKNFYLSKLYRLHLEKDDLTAPEYELLKNEISLKAKLKALISHVNCIIKGCSRKIRRFLGLYKR